MEKPHGQTAKRHYSAGGVVVSRVSGGIRVPLIATRRGERWGLPKGTVDEGETPEETAVREIREETGLEAEIVEHLGRIEYFFRARGRLIQKEVEFYLMRHVGGELTPQLTEVDDVQWFPLDEAIARESFESERRILEKAREILLKREGQGVEQDS